MKLKIVSHCWVGAKYAIPDGYSKDYDQLQVVTEDGRIWRRVFGFSERHCAPEFNWEQIHIEGPVDPWQK